MTSMIESEIKQLQYKVKAWTFQSKAGWNATAQQEMYRGWVKNAKAEIKQLKKKLKELQS